MGSSILIAALIFGSGSVFFAEEATAASVLEVGEASPENQLRLKEKKSSPPLNDIDNEITNARLRVQLGAKSRWSFRSDLSYSGGSIDKPLKSVRPNYRQGANTEEISDLSGIVGINYRLSDRDGLSFTTGVSVMAPFHGNLARPALDERKGMGGASIPRYQVTTPSLNWSRGYRALDLQMISGAAYSHYTGSWMADIHAIGALSVSQTVLANLGSSKWSGGVSGYISYSFYGGSVKNPLLVPSYQSGVYRRPDLNFGLYPFVEYAWSDKYSFHTSFGYFDFMKYKDEFSNGNRLLQSEPSQSLGIGISWSRDVYLYPNLQFAPKDIRTDRTNVALNAKWNI